MMGYLEAADSLGLWLVCAVVVVVVLAQTARFTVIAIRAGRQLGMSRRQMVTAFRTGATTAAIPSVAVLLGLAILMPSMGLPFSWMRLSVIGSVTYELMAARAAASQLGLENITADPTGTAFATAVWAMSLGVIFHLVLVAFFAPSIARLRAKVAGGDQGWMRVMTAAAFFGAVGYMAAQATVEGGASTVATAGGFLAMAGLGAVITIGKQKWLTEWAVAIAIVVGMATAGLWAQLTGELHG